MPGEFVEQLEARFPDMNVGAALAALALYTGNPRRRPFIANLPCYVYEWLEGRRAKGIYLKASGSTGSTAPAATRNTPTEWHRLREEARDIALENIRRRREEREANDEGRIEAPFVEQASGLQDCLQGEREQRRAGGHV